MLVVDDEVGVRTALRAILEPIFPVLTADSGDAALEIVARNLVGAVTLDLQMPGLSGIETLRRMRHIDDDLKVVIVTGVPDLETAVEGIRLRAFDYLSKPFDASVVTKTIRRALASRAETPLPAAASDLDAALETIVQRTDALEDSLWSSRRTDEIDLLRVLALAARNHAGAPASHWLDRLSEQIEALLDDLVRPVSAAGRRELGELGSLVRSIRRRSTDASATS